MPSNIDALLIKLAEASGEIHCPDCGETDVPTQMNLVWTQTMIAAINSVDSDCGAIHANPYTEESVGVIGDTKIHCHACGQEFPLPKEWSWEWDG